MVYISAELLMERVNWYLVGWTMRMFVHEQDYHTSAVSVQFILRTTRLKTDFVSACSILLSKLISRWKCGTIESALYTAQGGWIVWSRLWTSRFRKFWEVCVTAHWITGNFKRVRRIAKKDYRLRNVCPSIVRLSAKNNSAPTRWIFMKL
jgi:hypothetical protein